MILLRIYLLAGLIAHKALWEVLKRRQGHPRAVAGGKRSMKVRAVRFVKASILLGIVLQTLIPDSWLEPLQISNEAFGLRASGLVIYTLGLATAVLGRVQLGDEWSDIETARVGSSRRVVDRGIYRLIRHPIYVGDLLLLIGLELSLNSWLVLGAVALVPIVLRQAMREERMLVASLPGYPDYCGRTKRFVPFVV